MRFDSFEHLLRHFAETSPAAPALRYEKETLSFSQLLERVLARAEELKGEGKTCLGLLCDGSLDNVIEIFAANLAGLQLVLLDASLEVEILKTLHRGAFFPFGLYRDGRALRRPKRDPAQADRQ